MASYQLRESFQLGTVGKIDRENSVVHDVRVCGLKSGNGKRYSPKALREAIKLYDRAKVCFNHPKTEDNTRDYEDRFGYLFNVREANDGSGAIDADLKYNPAHLRAEQFLWDAEHNPVGMGLSHNALGNGRRESDGTILVEQITKVFSVDIVDGPATNYSLHEQQGGTVPDPVIDPAAAGVTDTGTAGGGGDVNTKLAALAQDFASHPEWDKKTKIEKLKALINLMEDTGGDTEPSDSEMMEQLKGFTSPAVRKAHKLILTEQRKQLAKGKGIGDDLITVVFLEQLTQATDEAAALKLIEDRRAVVNVAKAEKPHISQGKGGAPLSPTEIAASIDWD